MEASNVTVRGENADRLAETLVQTKARESKRSINKRGVRNIHTYEGEGFTQLIYERGSVYDPSWLVVSILVDRIDDRTCSVVTFVGGGGEGPFKMEEITMRRVIKGEESVGAAGRFATVLRDVNRICESLDLEVETKWQSETEQSLTRKLERKIFD